MTGPILTHGACGLAGLVVGAVAAVLVMNGRHDVADARADTKDAQAITKAVDHAAVTSNLVEKDLIDADIKTRNAVAGAGRQLAAVPPAVIIQVPGSPADVICEQGDPDALWRAFALGFNGVLDQADSGNPAVYPADGATKLHSGAPRP